MLLHGELMAGVPGASGDGARGLLGHRDGAHRLLPVRPRLAIAGASRTPGPGRRPDAQGHALVGAIAGLALLGLLVSGLPWTELWGSTTQQLATANGTSFWSDDHGALSEPGSTLDESLPHSHANIPWALGDQ